MSNIKAVTLIFATVTFVAGLGFYTLSDSDNMMAERCKAKEKNIEIFCSSDEIL